MMDRLIARPSPVPAGLVVKNGSKIFCSTSPARPGPEIADRDLDVAGVGGPRGDAHFEGRAVGFAAYGIGSLSLERVVHQVHEHLLDLHAVDRDPGQRRREIEREPAVVHARVAREQRVHLADQLVDVLRLAPHVFVAHQRANAPDDLAGAQCLPGDLFQRAGDLRHVGRRQAQQARAGLRVVGDRRQRLVELVRDARGHLAHGREARNVVHALERAVRFAFGAPLVGDVLAREHDAGRDVVGVAQRDAAPGDEAVFAVGGAHVVLAALRLVAAAHEQRPERIARDAAIFRRHAAVHPVAVDDLRVARAEHAQRALVDELHGARAIGGHQHHLRQIQVQPVELPFLFERRQRLAAQRGVVQEADELRRVGVRECGRRSGIPRIHCRRDAARARRARGRECAPRRPPGSASGDRRAPRDRRRSSAC